MLDGRPKTTPLIEGWLNLYISKFPQRYAITLAAKKSGVVTSVGKNKIDNLPCLSYLRS